MKDTSTKAFFKTLSPHVLKTSIYREKNSSGYTSKKGAEGRLLKHKASTKHWQNNQAYKYIYDDELRPTFVLSRQPEENTFWDCSKQAIEKP